MSDLSRQIAFNHATFGPAASFADVVDTSARAGAGGIGVWASRLDSLPPARARRILQDSGLVVTGVNRGGFFTASDAEGRRDAIEHTRRMIDLTVELGGSTLVIVPGGLSIADKGMDDARARVRDGLAAVAEHAVEAGVGLAIEPFHPALSAARSVVNTLGSALDLCDDLGPGVGVVTDIFHLWWDPGIMPAIARAGDRIMGHHLCDWKLDAADLFEDRAMMGDGVAEVSALTAAVLRTGYRGLMEVEIFSRNGLWLMDKGDIAEICMDKALLCLAEARQLVSRFAGADGAQ